MQRQQTKERVTEYYKGFQLVAAFYNGSYQSRAHHWWQSKMEISGCKSIDESLAAIRAQVDTDVAENITLYREKITEKHKGRLEAAKKHYRGTYLEVIRKREAHCYACKKPVATAYDLACKGCGWIICSSNCGACGCEYRGPGGGYLGML